MQWYLLHGWHQRGEYKHHGCSRVSGQHFHRGREYLRQCGFGKVNIRSLLVFDGALEMNRMGFEVMNSSRIIASVSLLNWFDVSWCP